MLIARVARFLFKTAWGAALLVFVVGLVTYAGFTAFYVGTSAIKHAIETDADLSASTWHLVDQDAYTVRAKQMISGEPYTDTYRQPLYPAFHAVVLLICGEHPTLLYNRLGNSVLGAVGCVAIYLLGRRLFGHTVGLVAGLIATVHINMVQKFGYIWPETLSVPLLVMALYFLIGFTDRRYWRDLLLGGLFFGLATLARPGTYYLTFLLPAWLWAVYGRITKPMLVRSAVLVLLILAILAPWAIHNTVITGRFMPVSGPKWQTLCACYAPEQFDQPLGNHKGAGIPIHKQKNCGFTAEELEQFGEDHAAAERACKKLFLRSLRQVWTRIPELVVYRTLMFLTLYLSPGREGLFYWMYHVQQIGLFVLFVAGLWLTRRQWRRLSVLYLTYFFLGIFLVCVFFGSPRRRLPVEPIIIVFAAMYLVWLVKKLVLRKQPTAPVAPSGP